MENILPYHDEGERIKFLSGVKNFITRCKSYYVILVRRSSKLYMFMENMLVN